MPPSYIRVCAVVWAYGCGQTDRQTDTHTQRHTDARDHNTFCVVYDSHKKRRRTIAEDATNSGDAEVAFRALSAVTYRKAQEGWASPVRWACCSDVGQHLRDRVRDLCVYYRRILPYNDRQMAHRSRDKRRRGLLLVRSVYTRRVHYRLMYRVTAVWKAVVDVP